VVALIRAQGEEVHILVVDQKTEELFHRMGITQTTSHVKGQLVHSHTHTHTHTRTHLSLFSCVSAPSLVEVYLDESATESAPHSPSPTTGLPASDPPVINITLTNSPITNASPKSWTNGNSASQSSRSSTTQSEISSSDMSIQVREKNVSKRNRKCHGTENVISHVLCTSQVHDEDERRVSDPLVDAGLRLSLTAAEAKQKALASRDKRRAPAMDWSRKHEVFGRF